jgi:hypothetical protein
MSDQDKFFEQLAALPEEQAPAQAPSRLKSRIYSAMVDAMAEAEPLASLTETKECGGRLCVFEEMVERSPAGDEAKRWNYCKVCHARVLGETVENAPIYWPGCPYVQFQNR